VCFGQGPSNHQGRQGEGGDLGVKSKGWGAFLMGGSHGFLGVPTKKLGDGRRGTLLVYAGFGEPGGRAECVLVRAPPTIKEDGGRGEIRA
jgi:hypothetical protein